MIHIGWHYRHSKAWWWTCVYRNLLNWINMQMILLLYIPLHQQNTLFVIIPFCLLLLLCFTCYHTLQGLWGLKVCFRTFLNMCVLSRPYCLPSCTNRSIVLKVLAINHPLSAEYSNISLVWLQMKSVKGFSVEESFKYKASVPFSNISKLGSC